METEGENNRRLKELQCQLRGQKAASEELGTVFHQRAQGVLGHDQAVILDELKARIKKEVDNARLIEMVAADKFIKEKFTDGLVDSISGALSSLITHRGYPLYEGATRFKSALGKKAPFDTVLIAIGTRGLPEGVAVIPLSKWARDYSRSETEIRDFFRNRGCLLMTPEKFAALVEDLQLRVIDGSMSLPLNIDQIASELSLE
jgi:hypothetical protein